MSPTKKKVEVKKPAARKPAAKPKVALQLPNADPKTKQLAKRSADLLTQVRTLVVKDRTTLEQATAILGHITREAKDVEERRVFFVKPIKEHAKAIDSFFKTLADPLEKVGQELRRKILVFREHEQTRVTKEQAERDAQAQAASARAEELRDAGDDEGANEAEESALAIATTSVEAAPDQSISVGSSRVTARAVWKFEVQDLKLIPREYFVLDEKLVRRAVMSGLRSIPGIRIFEEEQLAVSTNVHQLEDSSEEAAFN